MSIKFNFSDISADKQARIKTGLLPYIQNRNPALTINDVDDLAVEGIIKELLNNVIRGVEEKKALDQSLAQYKNNYTDTL